MSNRAEENERDRQTVEQVLMALRAVMRAVDLHSRFLVAHYGLTGPQLIILRRLMKDGPSSITELCRAVKLGQATMTGILDRLTRKGLVRRERSRQDKRKIMVAITEQGTSVLDMAPPLLQESFTSRFLQLADWEQTLILSSLQRVAAMMDATMDGASAVLASGPIVSNASRE